MQDKGAYYKTSCPAKSSAIGNQNYRREARDNAILWQLAHSWSRFERDCGTLRASKVRISPATGTGRNARSAHCSALHPLCAITWHLMDVDGAGNYSRLAL